MLTSQLGLGWACVRTVVHLKSLQGISHAFNGILSWPGLATTFIDLFVFYRPPEMGQDSHIVPPCPTRVAEEFWRTNWSGSSASISSAKGSMDPSGKEDHDRGCKTGSGQDLACGAVLIGYPFYEGHSPAGKWIARSATGSTWTTSSSLTFPSSRLRRPMVGDPPGSPMIRLSGGKCPGLSPHWLVKECPAGYGWKRDPARLCWLLLYRAQGIRQP